jgi:hypothetical protein
MNSKESAKSKKQSIVVNDLKAKKNPKGGGTVSGTVTVNEHGTVATLTAPKKPSGGVGPFGPTGGPTT